jgi:hypothetical protein
VEQIEDNNHPSAGGGIEHPITLLFGYEYIPGGPAWLLWGPRRLLRPDSGQTRVPLPADGSNGTTKLFPRILRTLLGHGGARTHDHRTRRRGLDAIAPSPTVTVRMFDLGLGIFPDLTPRLSRHPELRLRFPRFVARLEAETDVTLTSHLTLHLDTSPHFLKSLRSCLIGRLGRPPSGSQMDMPPSPRPPRRKDGQTPPDRTRPEGSCIVACTPRPGGHLAPGFDRGPERGNQQTSITEVKAGHRFPSNCTSTFQC